MLCSQALSSPKSLEGPRWHQVFWVACPIIATQSYNLPKETGPEGRGQTQAALLKGLVLLTLIAPSLPELFSSFLPLQ